MKESTRKAYAMAHAAEMKAANAYSVAFKKHFGDENAIKAAATQALLDAETMAEEARILAETPAARNCAAAASKYVEKERQSLLKKGLL